MNGLGVGEVWSPKGNCSAITRGSASCGGGKDVHHDYLFFRELKFLPVLEERVISEMRMKNYLIAAILQGSLMGSFTQH